jgi:cell migration-inducing and hyaluronan-binding protein
MDNGSSVIFELPGFTTAASGAQQSSLAALRDARGTAYFKDGDTLWVKLVAANTAGASGPGVSPAGTGLNVSRQVVSSAQLNERAPRRE